MKFAKNKSSLNIPKKNLQFNQGSTLMELVMIGSVFSIIILVLISPSFSNPNVISSIALLICSGWLSLGFGGFIYDFWFKQCIKKLKKLPKSHDEKNIGKKTIISFFLIFILLSVLMNYLTTSAVFVFLLCFFPLVGNVLMHFSQGSTNNILVTLKARFSSVSSLRKIIVDSYQKGDGPNGIPGYTQEYSEKYADQDLKNVYQSDDLMVINSIKVRSAYVIQNYLEENKFEYKIVIK